MMNLHMYTSLRDGHVSSPNTMRLEQKGCHFAGNIFKYILQAKNVCILIEISLKFVPKGQIGNKVSIGSGNGLAPYRCQAITWTNVDPAHWCHIALLGDNELTQWGLVLHKGRRSSLVKVNDKPSVELIYNLLNLQEQTSVKLIYKISFKTMNLKMLFAKRWPIHQNNPWPNVRRTKI